MASKKPDLVQHTVDIAASYILNNPISSKDLPGLIKTVHGTLNTLQAEKALEESSGQKPAVPISESVYDDYIVCLECGAKMRALKRHLKSYHGLTPDEYKAKWDLPADYPIVSPEYSKRRAGLAKQFRLGKGKKEDA